MATLTWSEQDGKIDQRIETLFVCLQDGKKMVSNEVKKAVQRQQKEWWRLEVGSRRYQRIEKAEQCLVSLTGLLSDLQEGFLLP